MVVVGNWVRRKEGRSKWHRVESDIASEAITRCGRRMDPGLYGGLEVSDVEPLTRMIGQPQICRGCL